MFQCRCTLDLQWHHPLDLPPVDAWLTRAAALHRRLLQAGQVPLLQPATVSTLTPPVFSSGPWRVEFEFKNPLALAVDRLQDTLIRTLKLMSWMRDHPLDVPEHRQQLFAALDREWIQPLRKQQPGGGSTLPLLRAAHRLAIPILPLGEGLYQFGWGRHGVRMHRSVTEHDGALAMQVSQDKYRTGRLLRAGGFPVTRHHRVRTLEEALKAADQLGWPLVVKPVDGERSEGVTLGITTAAALAGAMEHALRHSRQQTALVERQVPGHCHRLLVARGELLYVVERRPLSVIGTGRDTLRTLLNHHNEALSWQPPWNPAKPARIDDAMVAHLAGAGYHLDSIPAAGTLVSLRPFDTLAWGGRDIDQTAVIHPDNRTLAEQVAVFLGLDVAGIDLITPDIRVPWHQNQAQINEVNFAPMLGMWPISESYLPEFFRRYCPARGRIPVHLICGSARQAWDRGIALQQQSQQDGQPCHLTRNDCTLDPAGVPLPKATHHLAQRCLGLLLTRDVQGLIVVVSAPEDLRSLALIDVWQTIDIVTDDPATQSSWQQALAESGIGVGERYGSRRPEEAIG